MAIFRGAGGSGDATTDATNQASVASDAAAAALASQTAAANSAANASTSASSASTSASTASTSASTASSAASTATTQASNASTSATAAQTAETNAETAETNATASAALANDWATKTSGAVAGGEFSAKYHASLAETSATNAASSASTATTQAALATTNGAAQVALATTQVGLATTQASNASTSATAAAASATSAAASYDSFDDRYLGSKSSAPSVDNDGNALLTGALYWNTTASQLYIWTGSLWDAAAFSVSGAVTSFSGGSTGFTPNTATTGAVTLGGTLEVDNGGTGTSTAFTAGSVVFAGSSGTYTQNNAGFFWDNTNSRLGIGTTAPNTYGILATVGSINNLASALGTADAATISVLNNNVAGLGTKASLTMNVGGIGKSVIAGYYAAFNGSGDIGTGIQFGTQTNLAGGTVERMCINASGNVGIGTTSPDALLTVNTIASFGDGAVGTPSIAHKGDLNTGLWFPAADTIAASTAGSERVRITSAGNVGINLTSAASKLTIAGISSDITAQATNVGTLQLNEANLTNANGVGGIEFKTSVAGGVGYGSKIVGHNNGALFFATRANSASFTETMRIFASGGVSIGNTTDSGTASLNVGGSMSGGYIAHANGTTAMAFGSDNVARVTPTATATFTSTVPAAGAICVLSILTSGTSSYTITFGTGFKSTGTLATGTVSAQYFNITFVSDGTNLIEMSRTTAIT